jgi:hypothetical protein
VSSPTEYREDMRAALQATLHKHADVPAETGQVVHYIVLMEVLDPTTGEVNLIHSLSDRLSSWHAVGMLSSCVDDLSHQPIIYTCGGHDDDGGE